MSELADISLGRRMDTRLKGASVEEEHRNAQIDNAEDLMKVLGAALMTKKDAQIASRDDRIFYLLSVGVIVGIATAIIKLTA